MDSIYDKKTGRLTSRPEWRCVMKGKLIFKFKNEEDNNGSTMYRYKERWFSMGNRQVKGVDFTNTFAYVATFTTIRAILAM